MKKLIRQLVFFLLPIMLIFLCIEIFYRIVPNNYTQKNKNTNKNFGSAEVLIFGNSHTFYGLNPIYFDKPAFNMSNISQSLYFDQLLFNQYIDQFKKIDCIILNVEYFSLSQLDNSHDDAWRKYYYKSFMDLQVPIVSNLDLAGCFLSSTRAFSVNLKLVSRYFTEGTIVDCDENGFGTNYIKAKRIPNFDVITPIRIKGHEDGLVDFSNNTKRIQSIIDKCKSRGIRVVLVTMPVVKGYSRGVNQQKLSKIFKTCLALEKANKNVCYLNLFKDVRFTDDDFYDSDHLHAEGAIKCSLILNRFINKF